MKTSTTHGIIYFLLTIGAIAAFVVALWVPYLVIHWYQ